MESERQSIEAGNGMHALVCPRCRGKSFYDMRPQAAWCWASGRIETGDESAAPQGGIIIARGPKAFMIGAIAALARRGRGASEGMYLVPGIPEAAACQKARGDALATWLKWCARNNGHKGRNGVVFVVEQN